MNSSQFWFTESEPKLTNSLRKKCPYSELFWSVFSHIRTEYGEIRVSLNTKYLCVFSPNAEKCGPE